MHLSVLLEDEFVEITEDMFILFLLHETYCNETKEKTYIEDVPQAIISASVSVTQYS